MNMNAYVVCAFDMWRNARSLMLHSYMADPPHLCSKRDRGVIAWHKKIYIYICGFVVVVKLKNNCLVYAKKCFVDGGSVECN